MSEEYVQWNFDDLLSPKETVPPQKPTISREKKILSPEQPQERKVYTVEELTGEIKLLLEARFRTLWISGEVSGVRFQSSGHCYFTLKDERAQIQCVLFKSARGVKRNLIEEGKQLTLQGDLSLYELRGQYQIVVRAIEDAGQGNLAIEFERLKKKLEAEGLFAPERKRPIPLYPRRVGIVTSPTGAALQDILKVFRQESGLLELDVVLAPSKVQGVGAAEDISNAVKLLNRYHLQAEEGKKLDLILVTRGGGSTEDLWCFNEEMVARAIAASELPVISAVGHEIDFCISDFVADYRCATPTAAARLIVQNLLVLKDELEEMRDRFRFWLERSFASATEHLETFKKHLSILSPQRKIEDFWLRLDDVSQDLDRLVGEKLASSRTEVEHLKNRLQAQTLAERLERASEQTSQLKRRVNEEVRKFLTSSRSELELLSRSLKLLDPQANLARGYSMSMDAQSGKIVKSVKDLPPGTRFKTVLQDGAVCSVVEEGD